MSSSDPSRTVGDRQHLRLVDETGAIEVVLACASADVEAIREAFERLELHTGDARVLGGMERAADELRNAVTCSLQPTLFVLCRTGALEPAAARRAVECFGIKRPFSHRLLVAEFDARRPAGWMNAVRRSFVSMREAQALINGPIEGMLDSGDRNAVRGETRVTPPPTSVPLAKRPLVMFGRSEPAQGEGDEDPKSWWRDEVGPIPAHVRAPGARRHLAVVDPRETADDGGASISDAVLVHEPGEVVQAARSDSHDAPPQDRAPTRVARIVAVAIVALVVLGFAVAPVLGASHQPSPSPPEPPSPPAAPDAGGPVPSAAAPRPAPPSAPGPAAPAVSSMAESSASTPPPSALDRAVAEGRLGRLDGLYVVEGPDRAMDWYGAANTCRARSIDGARGFRLPSIDELRWLRRRGLVSGGRDQWSGTRVFGRPRENWVLVTKGGLSAVDKDESAAYVVCVRGH